MIITNCTTAAAKSLAEALTVPESWLIADLTINIITKLHLSLGISLVIKVEDRLVINRVDLCLTSIEWFRHI